MAKFSLAFIIPSDKSQLKHFIAEGIDQDSILKKFFTEQLTPFYSDDEQGYHYFLEDFFDAENPSGSIITLE